MKQTIVARKFAQKIARFDSDESVQPNGVIHSETAHKMYCILESSWYTMDRPISDDPNVLICACNGATKSTHALWG